MARIVAFAGAAALLLTMGGVAHARTAQEVGYAPGALGVDAIMHGDMGRAEVALTGDARVAKGDAARLLNLGYVYAQTGRIREARAVLNAAYAAPDGKVLLSDGREISSRKAAVEAMAWLDGKYALR